MFYGRCFKHFLFRSTAPPFAGRRDGRHFDSLQRQAQRAQTANQEPSANEASRYGNEFSRPASEASRECARKTLTYQECLETNTQQGKGGLDEMKGGWGCDRSELNRSGCCAKVAPSESHTHQHSISTASAQAHLHAPCTAFQLQVHALSKSLSVEVVCLESACVEKQCLDARRIRACSTDKD